MSKTVHARKPEQSALYVNAAGRWPLERIGSVVYVELISSKFYIRVSQSGICLRSVRFVCVF